jgi:hypothetical protein
MVKCHYEICSEYACLLLIIKNLYKNVIIFLYKSGRDKVQSVCYIALSCDNLVESINDHNFHNYMTFLFVSPF